MSKAKTRRKRKQRRQQNAKMKFGNTAAPKHIGRSGRTGSMHGKKLRGARGPANK